MIESSKEARTVVDRLKKLLYNYDLEIVYAKGEIKLRQASMSLYENDIRRNSQKKFVVAKVDKERFENYVDELENAKREITDNLEIILSKYTPRYRQVFIMYFFENKTYDEICEATHYAPDGLKKIIQKLKSDLIQLYFVAD